jgi:hypothetical protein
MMSRFQFRIGTIMIVIAAAAAVMGLTRFALSLPPEYKFLTIFIAIAVGASVLGGAAELAIIWYSFRPPRR